MVTDIESMLRVGDTLFPLIFMSNGTHLSNSAGDKKKSPVYVTIGNLSSKIRQVPSTHCRNGRSPADSDQELQYSSEAAR